MKQADQVFSAILLVVAAFFMWGAHMLPMGELRAPGAGLMPFLEGVLLAVGAGALMISSLRGPRTKRVEWPTGDARRMVIYLWAALLGYVALIAILGYIVSTLLFVFAVSNMWRQHSWRVLGVWAVVLSLSLYAIFGVLLKTPLPAGLFGLR